jgi:hypothetical protein
MNSNHMILWRRAFGLGALFLALAFTRSVTIAQDSGSHAAMTKAGALISVCLAFSLRSHARLTLMAPWSIATPKQFFHSPYHPDTRTPYSP